MRIITSKNIDLDYSMKICVYSQQKTGSTTIFELLEKVYDVDKRHYNINALKKINYDIIIIPLRCIKEIVISGYFNNILIKFIKEIDGKKTEPNDIKKLDIDVHVNNILNYDWNKDYFYTIKSIERSLKDVFQIDITNFKFNNYKIFKATNKYTRYKTTIVLCNFIKMTEESRGQMFNEIGLNIDKTNHHTNIGEKKWYKDLYKQTKERLKDEKFENLYDLDFTPKCSH